MNQEVASPMERAAYIPAERQKKMIEYVEAKTSAQIHELAAYFQVSEATVRRDLDELDQQGALRRTHGGAIKMERSTSYEQQYSEKMILMTEEKRRIAARAAQLVHTGDTVIVDAGTTGFFIAQALSHHENLTIITNDLYTAYQTPLHPSSTMVVAGGTRRRDHHELTGTRTENFLREVRVDLAFVCVDAIDLTGGVTTTNFAELGEKRLMQEAAMRSVIAADHTKFGRVALARICDLKDVDLLLTDSALNPEMLARIRKLPVEIELA